MRGVVDGFDERGKNTSSTVSDKRAMGWALGSIFYRFCGKFASGDNKKSYFDNNRNINKFRNS